MLPSLLAHDIRTGLKQFLVTGFEPSDSFFHGLPSAHLQPQPRCDESMRHRYSRAIPELYLNYRTTEEIRKRALALLEGCEIDDLDDGRDENRLYKSLSHGPAPGVAEMPDLEAALAKIESVITQAMGQSESDPSPSTTCVIAYSRQLRDLAKQRISSRGIETQVIEANEREPAERGGVRFATMHRAKGLEFDRVIVLAPTSVLGSPEETAGARRLLYVSLTRARRAATLVFFGLRDTGRFYASVPDGGWNPDRRGSVASH